MAGEVHALTRRDSLASKASDKESPPDEVDLRPLIFTESELSRSFLEQRKQQRLDCHACLPVVPQSCGECGAAASRQSKSWFPILEWMPRYQWRHDLFRDFVVGVTLAFVIAPKAMAHAILAQRPPIVGIYTAFAGTLVYGLMGTNKWVSCGTGALPALMYGQALLAIPTPAGTRSLGPMLSLYIAAFTAVLALLRLDKVLKFMPPATMTAFNSAAALIIGTTQIKFLFGVKVSSSEFLGTYVEIVPQLPKTNVATLLLALLCLSILAVSKYYLQYKLYARFNLPDVGALLVTVLSVTLEATLHLNERWGVDVVGPTPAGFPPLKAPWAGVPSSLQGSIAMQAIVIAIVNTAIFLTETKSFGKMSKCKMVRPYQDMRALATGNAVGSFMGAEVITSSFSGSAVVASLKVTSMMHNNINTLLMLILMLFLTGVVELIPKVTLACIIIMALPSLVNLREPFMLWRIKRDDCFMWFVTFNATLWAGVQWGIVSAFAVALCVLARRSSKSECSEVGVLPGTTIYRALDRFPDAKRVPKVAIFRLDASLSFSNYESVTQRLEDAVHRFAGSLEPPSAGAGGPPATIGTVILDMSAVNDIDSPGIDALCRFAKTCEDLGLVLVFACWKSAVRTTLYAAHIQWLLANGKSDAAGLTAAAKPAAVVSDSASPTPAEVELGLGATSFRHPESEPQAQQPPHNHEQAAAAAATTTTVYKQQHKPKGRPFAYHTVVAIEATHGEPAPLDPNTWYLSLHDAVMRVAPKPSDPPSASSEGSTPGNQGGLGGAHQRPETQGVALPVALPVVCKDDVRLASTPPTHPTPPPAQTPPTQITTEITPKGDIVSWNYTRPLSEGEPAASRAPRSPSASRAPRSPGRRDAGGWSSHE